MPDPVAPPSQFVEAAGVRLHYQEVGSGYPVIGLHGAGPGASSWSNFRRNVGAVSERFRFILVDMPQYGLSEKVRITEGRLTFVSRVMEDFMRRLDVPKAHFLGNSMGGQVAIKLAIDHPERVDRLVVIGSCPVGYSIFGATPVEGVRLIGAYYRGDGPSREKLRHLLSTLLSDPSLLTDQVLEERYQASIDPEVAELFRNSPPPREDLSDQLHKVAAPTLIIWGHDDRFASLDVGLLMLRRFENARMHIFSRCGHWAQVERADEFNRLVVDFFTA